MMKEKIKEKLKNSLGKRLKFKYNGARNQNEEFMGVIDNLYSNVFTIKVDKDINFTKSFSYNDVLIGTLEIFDK